jgi:hypothetical protein
MERLSAYEIIANYLDRLRQWLAVAGGLHVPGDGD